MTQDALPVVKPRTAPALSDPELWVLDGLVSSIVATRAGIAAAQALEAQLFAAAYRLGVGRADGSLGDGDLPIREVAAEIGAAVRVSDRTVQRQLVQAQVLTSRFPATAAALGCGTISRAHVSVIVEAGDRIDDDECRAAFEAAALAVAVRETPGRLRPIAVLLAEKTLPQGLTERHRVAVADRGVWVKDLDDGMSQLTCIHASVLVHGIHDRLTGMAPRRDHWRCRRRRRRGRGSVD